MIALRIMQTNYEQIVKAQQLQPGHTETPVADEVKFSVVRLCSANNLRVFLNSLLIFSFKQLWISCLLLSVVFR